jgi:hypothetical protein
MTVLWIVLALAGGVLLGRATNNSHLLDRIEVLEDLLDDAWEKLNLAKRDPITGSSFISRGARARLRQIQESAGGWLPNDEFPIEIKQGRLARAYEGVA